MDFFIKHQTVILRSLGSVLFLFAFVAFFWTTPKKGLSENELAAANVARMEARVTGAMGGSSGQKEKPKHSPFMQKYKDTQAQQMRYALIVIMIVGAGFLGYSFLKKNGD